MVLNNVYFFEKSMIKLIYQRDKLRTKLSTILCCLDSEAVVYHTPIFISHRSVISDGLILLMCLLCSFKPCQDTLAASCHSFQNDEHIIISKAQCLRACLKFMNQSHEVNIRTITSNYAGRCGRHHTN